MDKQMLVQLEQLRSEMIETALLVKEDFLHHDVLELSQLLDKIIVQVQVEQRVLTRV